MRRAVALALLAATLAGCPTRRDAAWFEERAAAAGLRFQHRHGAQGPLTLLHSTGAGCAWFDYDDDGRPDAFLVNGAPGAGNRLFRNLGAGRFADVTGPAGVTGAGFGMGCAVGDYDGDGHIDLYVTNQGRNELFRNRGDGTFEETAARAGVAVEGWSIGAAFLDADGDGDLDLYVARYVRWGPPYPELCGEPGVLGSCTPRSYPSEPDLFFENLGGGRFADRTAGWGVADPGGRGMGVLPGDFDGDGRPDLYVANDTTANYLWRNRGGRRFEEAAARLGAALGPDGRGEAGMGCDAADFDGDGRWDLLVGNFQREMDALYHALPDGSYAHVSAATGLGRPSAETLTFGVAFADVDNDGRPDTLAVNGHINDRLERVDPDSPFRQPRQLFLNLGGRFEEAGQRAGAALVRPGVGRGLAVADYDDDGRLDLLVNENGGAAQLLRNTHPAAGNWLRLRLVGPLANRMSLGAVARVTAGGRRQMAEVRSAAGYASVFDARPHFGLGAAPAADEVTVRWPDGRILTRRAVPANQTLTLRHADAR